MAPPRRHPSVRHPRASGGPSGRDREHLSNARRVGRRHPRRPQKLGDAGVHQAGGQQAEQPTRDDVVDAEFEEVKDSDRK